MSAPAIVRASAVEALAPIRATLRAMNLQRSQPPLRGIALDLDPIGPGFVSSRELVRGDAIDEILDAAQEHWAAAPHAAAALAWKSYSYWVSLPAVLGFAAARRVPLLRPDAVQVRWSTGSPFVTVALTSVEVAVLADDPMVGHPGVRWVPTEEELLDVMRTTLLDEHLDPVIDQLRERVHLGRRTLLGSVASGIAHGLSRAADLLPGPTLDTAHRILDALDLADLVELAAAPVGLDVQRKTCCLAFTLDTPKICGGCCIR